MQAPGPLCRPAARSWLRLDWGWVLDLWHSSELLPDDRYAAWADEERARLGELAQECRIRFCELATSPGLIDWQGSGGLPA